MHFAGIPDATDCCGISRLRLQIWLLCRVFFFGICKKDAMAFLEFRGFGSLAFDNSTELPTTVACELKNQILPKVTEHNSSDCRGKAKYLCLLSILTLNERLEAVSQASLLWRHYMWCKYTPKKLRDKLVPERMTFLVRLSPRRPCKKQRCSQVEQNWNSKKNTYSLLTHLLLPHNSDKRSLRQASVPFDP